MELNNKYLSLLIVFFIIIGIIIYRQEIILKNKDNIINLKDRNFKILQYKYDSVQLINEKISIDRIKKEKIRDSINKVIKRLSKKIGKDSINFLKTLDIDEKIPQDSIFIILKQKYVEDSINKLNKHK